MADRRYKTEKELAYLRKAYEQNVPVATIARRVKCSVKEVYYTASYHKIRRTDWVPQNKIKWTKREIQFINKNFHSMTNPQLAKALGKKLTVVRIKCKELGLLHMKLQYWTKEQIDYLVANYKTMGDVDLANEFNRRWKKAKGWNKKHIEKKRGYLGLKRTTEEQFLLRTGRFKAKDYKDFDGKKFPQGKKRVWFANGKPRMMIKMGAEFIPLHRHKWEKLRGPIPEGYKIAFKDGNTLNCSISNLILVTQSQLCKRIAQKLHSEQSDSYIAGIMARGNADLKKRILNTPGLIEAKRQQLNLYRSIKPKRKQQ